MAQTTEYEAHTSKSTQQSVMKHLQQEAWALVFVFLLVMRRMLCMLGISLPQGGIKPQEGRRTKAYVALADKSTLINIPCKKAWSSLLPVNQTLEEKGDKRLGHLARPELKSESTA